jgi:hypothetical protein
MQVLMYLKFEARWVVVLLFFVWQGPPKPPLNFRHHFGSKFHVIIFCKLFFVKIQGLTRGELCSLLSFCNCYPMGGLHDKF